MASGYNFPVWDPDNWFGDALDLQAWFDPEAGNYTTPAPAITLTAVEGADTAVFVAQDTARLTAVEGADTSSFRSSDTTQLAAVEASDVSAFRSSDTGQLAAVEGADTASFTFDVQAATPITLTAVEGADTAAFLSADTERLTAVEGADTATFRSSDTGQLAAVEAADTTTATVQDTAQLVAVEASDTTSGAFDEVAGTPSIALGAVEDPDTASFSFEAVQVEPPFFVVGDGGGSRPAWGRKKRKSGTQELNEILETMGEEPEIEEAAQEMVSAVSPVDRKALTELLIGPMPQMQLEAAEEDDEDDILLLM